MAFNQVSNEKLAELYSRGEQSGQGSNMFIKGETIYSYGEHYKIATRLNPQQKFATNIEYVFNSDGYSNTTAKHKAHVRSNLRSYIELPSCDFEEQSLISYIEELKAEINKIVENQSKLKKKGKKFQQYQDKIVLATQRVKEVENFKIALYGGNAVHFIKEVA